MSLTCPGGRELVGEQSRLHPLWNDWLGMQTERGPGWGGEDGFEVRHDCKGIMIHITDSAQLIRKIYNYYNYYKYYL